MCTVHLYLHRSIRYLLGLFNVYNIIYLNESTLRIRSFIHTVFPVILRIETRVEIQIYGRDLSKKNIFGL